ncbi:MULTISPECIES: MIP/aquaporin family protein [Natronorubrum]|uniref:MIP family protein n=2 Tax=Natronorubrum bangense TaxID=61858 RepID=A0A4D6HJM7_9EURY|nr:aquaporin [Natronorubrum bangense]ELY47794.1 putative glycerol uptake transporter protein, MIP family [Natronorubrum bangense JCM 10635]QCC53725.1 MIP family protein [Natronorubrum bangense]
MSTEQFTTRQKLIAEAFGSATLVFVLVSSGLLADGMLQATPSIGVLFIGLATAGWLFVIVQILAPISGAHVNPAVTIALVVTGDVDGKTARQYIPAQFLGGVIGVGLAGLTFVSTIGWEVFAISAVERPASTWLAEFVGTIVLVSAVISLLRQESDWIGLAVGFTVGMGIIATSSTAFLNPQVAFARIFTSGIAGIQPFDAVMFMFASTLGGIAAGLLWRYLWPRPTPIDRLKPEPGDDSLLDEVATET